MSRDTAESPRLVTGTNPRRGPKAAWSIERRRRLAVEKWWKMCTCVLLQWHQRTFSICLQDWETLASILPRHLSGFLPTWSSISLNAVSAGSKTITCNEPCGTNHWEAMERFRVLEVVNDTTTMLELVSVSIFHNLEVFYQAKSQYTCRPATQPFVAEAFLATAASHKAVAPIHPPTSKTTESGLVIIWVTTFRQKTGKVSDLIWFDVYWTMNLWWWWTSIPSPNSFMPHKVSKDAEGLRLPVCEVFFQPKPAGFESVASLLVVYILKTCWQIKRNYGKCHDDHAREMDIIFPYSRIRSYQKAHSSNKTEPGSHGVNQATHFVQSCHSK